MSYGVFTVAVVGVPHWSLGRGERVDEKPILPKEGIEGGNGLSKCTK